MSYFLAVGCSHTAGVAIDPNDIYIEHISKNLGIQCCNYSRAGGDSEYALQQIVKTLRKNNLPLFIIAQWPNMYRKMFWNDKDFYFENVHSCGEIFNELLKQSDNNFVRPWIQHIITADTVSTASGVPIYHICLEDYNKVPMDILEKHNIKLHADHKKPGESWLFDSAASDGLHHSPMCHRAWADRLIGIINENTTR